MFLQKHLCSYSIPEASLNTSPCLHNGHGQLIHPHLPQEEECPPNRHHRPVLSEHTCQMHLLKKKSSRRQFRTVSHEENLRCNFKILIITMSTLANFVNSILCRLNCLTGLLRTNRINQIALATQDSKDQPLQTKLKKEYHLFFRWNRGRREEAKCRMVLFSTAVNRGSPAERGNIFRIGNSIKGEARNHSTKGSLRT